MPDKIYLDDNGNPVQAAAKVYLDDNGEPVGHKADAPQAEERSIGGFLGNVASSGGRFIKDAVTGIPAMAGMAGKAAMMLANPAAHAQDFRSAAESAPRMVSAAGSALKNRYGGVEQIKNTLYNDPVGVAADASMILDPLAGLAKAGGLAKTAGVLAKGAEVTNPMRAIGRVVEPMTHGTANAVVRSTLRPPAAVREDFGGSKAIADGVLKDRVYSEASAGRKLDHSVRQADQMLVDAQASGVPGVPRRDVANAVIGGEPREMVRLDAKLGNGDASRGLMDAAKGVLRSNPREIPLTDAQAMKRRAQTLAYEAGADNNSAKKAAEIAKAKALRGGIESRVPDVGPVNEQSQRLLGSKLAFGAAEDRPQALTNMFSIVGGLGGGAVGGPMGALGSAALMKAVNSPRAGAIAGIGIDSFGRGMNANSLRKAALVARLLENVQDE